MRAVRPVFLMPAQLIRCLARGYFMAALIASLGSVAFGESPATEISSQHPTRCQLSIARSPLNEALVQLAQHCGLQLARLADVGTSNIIVGPVSGLLTREEALEQLLRGTGLTYHFISDQAVAIVRREAAPATSPAPAQQQGGGTSAGKGRVGASNDRGQQNATDGSANERTGKTSHVSLLSRLLALFAVCGTASLHPEHACAQEAADSSTVLQEVVVTAERRAVNLQNTSVSETAISGNELLEKHINVISDLESQVPGLSVTSGGFTQNINIRGMGNTTAAPTVTTGVPVFRDGLYQPEAILLTEPFYDIADVEVLRGPQGTIIGQNSTGGALVINSNNPNFDGVNGYTEVVAGNFNLRQADGAVNLPVNDVLAARVAFNYETQNSFFTNIGPQLGDAYAQINANPGHIDEKNVRLGVLFKPNDVFQALAKIEINDLQTGGLTARPLPACSICAADATFYQYGYNGPSAYNGFRNLSVYQLDYNTAPTSQHDRADRYSLELKYTLPGDITLRSLTGHQYLLEQRIDDVDASAAPIGVGGSYGEDTIGPDAYYSQEFDIISPDTGRVTWLAGTSYFYRTTPVDYVQYPYGAVPEPGGLNGLTVLHIGTHVHLFGAFGQVSWQIDPTLQLQVGLRYSDDGQTTSGTIFIPGPNLVISNAGQYSKSVPSGKIALNYTPVHGQNFYGFWARGFKDGGINNAVSTFNPEYIDDYELGWKGEFLDDHLRTQLGGYYTKYRNMQQQVLNPLGGGNSVINLTSSKIEGIEFSSQARLGHWTANLGLSYNHSVLGSARAIAAYETPAAFNTNLPQCAAGQAAGCNDYSPYVVSLNGDTDPYSPKYQGNLSLSYVFDLSGNSTLTPRVDYSYTGSQWASIFQNTNYYLLSARRLLDLYLNYGYKTWNVQLFMHNATNQTYIQGMGSAPTSAGGGAGADAFWGDPRTFGVSIKTTF